MKIAIKKGQEKQWEHIQKTWEGEMNQAVIKFAKRWANKMEKGFKGEFNHEVALRTKKEVLNAIPDSRALNNHMFGSAVHLLSVIWIFGEHLRQWHNITRSGDNLSQAVNANVRGEIIY